MIFSPTPLNGSFIIDLESLQDKRGWFARYYCKNEFSQIGHKDEWVQMNHSFTSSIGTVRGMHFQKEPFKEIKLIRCVAGAVFDVIVDLRMGSPTFLKWFGVELSAGNKRSIYVPEGFAHGFQSLSDNCELLYHHSAFYQPGLEGGLKYNDPAVGINWPLPVSVISERDDRHTLLDKDFKGI
ncbi:MAG TPA: dTDP-4-dehydrorhamnose 3,5-epimerase [Chitinophagaceae bacterium]|nr:dTDP-4-dehydrorhamnose 3,5-epimerase [Chitinophagaceae bacterium]